MRERWPIPRLVKLEINWLLNKSPLWDVTVMDEGWMRPGEGVVDFWMETGAELNRPGVWGGGSLDGLRSESGEWLSRREHQHRSLEENQGQGCGPCVLQSKGVFLRLSETMGIFDFIPLRHIFLSSTDEETVAN